MITLNRLANTHNRHQDQLVYPRCLCVCSAGMLRSPTMAWVLGNPPFNFNTRAAGVVEEYALIPVDLALLEWADIIVCAQDEHREAIRTMIASVEAQEYLSDAGADREIFVLNIFDQYKYRHWALVKEIEEKARKVFNR